MESKKKNFKGGHHLRLEPFTMHEINASPLAKICFERTGCLRFCELLMEEGYRLQLTSLFSSNIKMGKVIIEGVEFNLSSNMISLATGDELHH